MDDAPATRPFDGDFVYANGGTYLCHQRTGRTCGHVYGDGSGGWDSPRQMRGNIHGPRGWLAMVRSGDRVRIEYSRRHGWRWVILGGDSRCRSRIGVVHKVWCILRQGHAGRHQSAKIWWDHRKQISGNVRQRKGAKA